MINTDRTTKEAIPMKYSTIYVKEDTKKEFFQYVTRLAQEKGERVTSDDAINALLDCVERGRKKL